ncbi:hypothetical protein NQZ68_014920 [Dissostichus eleginoides]|nr:hypothetical protein NQZ68_014920 [Dissostichus eleginoides]
METLHILTNDITGFTSRHKHGAKQSPDPLLISSSSVLGLKLQLLAPPQSSVLGLKLQLLAPPQSSVLGLLELHLGSTAVSSCAIGRHWGLCSPQGEAGLLGEDATIARSNAAILLRSAPPTHQSLLDMRLILVPEMKVIHLEIFPCNPSQQLLRESAPPDVVQRLFVGEGSHRSHRVRHARRLSEP